MTIKAYTAATPNGQKLNILLEELKAAYGLQYEVVHVDLSKDEQKEDWFLKINPNGRIPAIVDTDRSDFAVFESGAIMHYLCEHYDPEDRFSHAHKGPPDAQSQLMQWLFFQNAGAGPMQGQANHFFRYAPTKIQYGIDRYQNETRRLYGVLERQLQDTQGPFLLGGKYTTADMATFAWVRWEGWAGIGLDKFPLLKAWSQRIEDRPAVKQGLLIPDGEDQIVKLRKDPNVGDPFQKWVMKGQDEIKDKHGK